MNADQNRAVTESYEDMCLAFFIELRDKYHYRLSADQLLNFLKIDTVDIGDIECIRANMAMFFCHQQYEYEKFPEIFDSFFLSDHGQSAIRLRKLERKKSERAAENRNMFLQQRTTTTVTDQKVHFSLPNFRAEWFFAHFESEEGICDYSSFIHAGFLNLYDDYTSYYNTLDDSDRQILIDTLVSELSRFISYCKKMLDDPEDFCRKSLELAATFKMAGNTETGSRGDGEAEEELSDEELEKEIEKEQLQYQMQDNRVPMAEDFTKKDIRLLTKKDMDTLERYIRENAHKFKARVSQNLKHPGKSEFDYKRTVREAFKTAMVPVNLYYKNPKPRKIKIVCLLDISPSCLSAATVLVHFLHELGDVFHGGVEIYYFTDHCEKVTAEVRNRTITDCINNIVTSSKGSVSSYSDAFESFNKNFYNDLTKDTVFMILGDMRNNYKPYKKEPLRKIHDRVNNGHGKVMLLNTDPKRRWYKDDSVLRRAEAAIDDTYEVRCVDDIIKFLCELKI